ncbi:hypothetical protein ACWDBD_46955 [Streptomyces sp. NPDC001118]
MNPPARTAAAVVLAAAAVVLAVGCGSSHSGGDAKPAAATTAPPTHQTDPNAHSPGPAPSATAHLTDPAAVVRAYITASQTVTAADATAPPRRAEAYMAPDNAERGIGQPVYDVPPAGTTRQPTHIKVTQAAAKGGKAVYQVTYTPALTRDGHTIKEEKQATTYVVCEKQPDGSWLVSRDDPSLTPEGVE